MPARVPQFLLVSIRKQIKVNCSTLEMSGADWVSRFEINHLKNVFSARSMEYYILYTILVFDPIWVRELGCAAALMLIPNPRRISATQLLNRRGRSAEDEVIFWEQVAHSRAAGALRAVRRTRLNWLGFD